MKLKLQARCSMMLTALIIAVIASLSITLVLQFRASAREIRDLGRTALADELVEQVRERGVVIASFVAESVADALARDDAAAVGAVLERARQHGVEYVLLNDADGRLLHGGGRDLRAAGVIVADEPGRRGSRIDGELLEIGQPVLQAGELVGSVRVGLSLAPIRTEVAVLGGAMREISRRGLRANLLATAAATVLFLLGGMAAAFWLSRSLAQPIRRLASQARSIGRGDYVDELAVERSDELGELAGAFRDMSHSLRASHGEVSFLAFHDSLTRLPNRAQLKRFLAQAVARADRSGHRVALLFIDLDDFKRVNDTLGHKAGDRLLKEFSQRLATCLRRQDLVDAGVDAVDGGDLIARLGGDEFTVVIEDVDDSRDIATVAERTLELLQQPFVLAGQEVVVGASIGITAFPDDGDSVDALLRNADVAMFEAKAKGKNHYQFYNQTMDRTAGRQLAMEADLRHALERDQMELLYQPVIDTVTGSVIGLEALARWNHAEQGVIPAAGFLPLAEESGLVVALDEWAIGAACRDLRRLHVEGCEDLFVSVNVSSVHFREQRVAAVVAEELVATGLSPHRLRLELSETTIMRNTARSIELARALREQDVAVWVDNFGSGQAALTHLTRLPINGLKIDHEFVHRITRGADERSLVATIIAMGHSLGLSVGAEGLEREEELLFARKVGCDAVQGRLFAGPMALEALAPVLGTPAPFHSLRFSSAPRGATPLPAAG